MSETKTTKAKAAAAPAAPTAPATLDVPEIVAPAGPGLKPQVKVVRVNPDAKMPVYGSKGAACFDLAACLPTADGVGVNPSNPRVFNTGLKFEVPEGHVMLVFSRSGHGFKNDVRLSNAVGVIDADYRGEVKVKLTRDPARDSENFTVYHGDRIAQAVILPVQQFEFIEVDELSETERGEGGFGSTGSQ